MFISFYTNSFQDWRQKYYENAKTEKEKIMKKVNGFRGESFYAKDSNISGPSLKLGTIKV